jgi:galactonate dehydratase
MLGGGWFFVQIHTDEGITGLGEASQGGNSLVQTYLEQRLRNKLIGRDPTQIETISNELLAQAQRRAPATAVSAVEQALWDIYGQKLGLPIWALLGERYRGRINLYANINRATFDRSPSGFADSASHAVTDGFTAVKCAPFDGVSCRFPDKASNMKNIKLGIQRVAAIRDAVGPDIKLMVDCHSRFDVSMAIKVAKELEPLNLSWLEEPLPRTDLDGLRFVREHIGMPVAGGESLIGRSGFWDIINRRLLDVIMPDVKHTGGILELRKIAATAEVCGLSISPHNPSGPVSTLASVHVSAVLPNFMALEYPWGEAPWRRELVAPEEIVQDGAITVPDRPGLGFALNEDVVCYRLAADK